MTVYILKAGRVQCITVYFTSDSVHTEGGACTVRDGVFSSDSVHTEAGACTVHHGVFCKRQCIYQTRDVYSASRCILQATMYILKAGRVQCITVYFTSDSVYTEGGVCTVHHGVFYK